MGSLVNIWSGGVGPDGAAVVAKLSGATSARLAIDVTDAMSAPAYTSAVTPTAQGIARFTLSGLDADTQYYYAVEIDSVLDTTVGQFHTHGPIGDPYSFMFAASACAGGAGDTLYPTTGALLPHYVSSHPVFRDIRDQQPLFFMHSGDLHYYNIGRVSDDGPTDGGDWPATTLTNHRRAYDDILLSTQGDLYLTTPIQYVWDNHDSAQDTADDGSSNRHSAGMTNASQVYRERVPSYPLAVSGTTGGIYHSWQIGRVLFIASDTRYYRDDPVSDPSPRTYLGADQLTWMESVLSTSDAELLIWQQTQDWCNSITTQDGNGWGRYGVERANLVSMFRDTGWINKMMTIFGDTHAMALDNGGGNNHGGFPMALLCSLDSDQNAGPTTYNIGRKGSTTSGVRGQWGTVSIEDDGSELTVTTTGWSYS